MASPQTAYRNPAAPSSAKRYASLEIANLILYSTLPKGPRHTLAAAYRAARSPQGVDVLLWPALKGIWKEATTCERTARYHLRKLEELGAISLVYNANSRIRPDHFRHTATYRLNISWLREHQRQSYQQYKDSRPIAEPKGPQSVKHPSMVPAPAPTPAPVAQSKPPALNRREREKLIKRMTEYMHGRTEHVGVDGYGYKLDPSDPRYLAPMKARAATIAACQDLGTPIASAIEALKLAGWEIQDE